LKKKITVLWMTVLLCLALAGCGSKSSNYEGAGIKIKYDPSDWSIFYREADENTNVIEMYYNQGGTLSIVACEAEPESAEEIYQGMIDVDQMLGEVSGMSAQNNMAEEKGTASYAHRTKTNFSSDYWTLFYGKNPGNGKVILAAATIYIDDEETADQCKKDIEEIIASLALSEKTELGEITKAMIDPGVETNVLVNYLNDGQKIYSYMEGSALAEAEPVSVEGMEYVQKVTLKDGGSGQEIEVYGPIDNAYSSESAVSYFDHGIYFDLFLIGSWDYMDPIEVLTSCQQEIVKPLKDNEVVYQNLVIDDMVTVEEGLCYYQHTSVEELDAREIASENHYLVYVGTAPNGIGYILELDVTGSNTDKETNAVLEEIGKCYNLDLTGYGNSAEDLTNSGELVDMSQDVYTQKSDEPEIRAIEGYTYMGASEISDYNNNNIYELLIPMGKRTSNSGHSLSANMHGVYVNVSVTSLYRGASITEIMQSDLNYRYDYMMEYSRDYKNVSTGEIATTTEGEGLYGSVSADKADYDGLIFPYHEIIYILKINDESALDISIRLDERDYDVYTNVLLQEIEQAYRMDLSDFYYEP